MNNKIRFSKFNLVAVLAALLLAIPLTSVAQETTSSIRGKVLDSSGSAVSSASVIVEDMRTGVRRPYSTNANGVFLATRLPPGGPYKVTVGGTKTVDIPSITLADVYHITLNLQSAVEIEEIITIGQTADVVDVAAGPASVFSSFDLATSVAFDRDITDVYGVDPRFNIDNEDDGFEINCMGMHPRFNSVTLDGVSQNDRFGLNSNGYSTATGMPFPYDALEQVAVELAPFDVTYGGFSACNINAVTKSGSNTWEGSVFYEWTSQKLRGDIIDGQDVSGKPYTEDKYGVSIGGPIIKDRLFIFAAYEKSEEPRFLAKGYSGSGSGVERPWLSEADYNRIVSIANSLYQYDPGGQPGDGAQENEKYMVRLDLNITEDHNAALIYNYFDGFQDRDSDGDPNEFEFANHYYVKGAESETITFKLASQWTDAFSTELFFSTNEMNDSQNTVGPNDFGDFQISVGGRAGTVYLGADDSRQANRLGTESVFGKISAQFLLGDHVFTAGYEREELEIFNIFVQHSRGGEWDFFDDSVGNPASCDALDAAGRFADSACDLSGIDRFELGRPSRVYYGSAGGTNVATDAAAVFTNVTNSVYLQDEIFFDNLDLTIIAGLRYEFFESSDNPVFNPAFAQANGGLNNADNIDGLDLIMPRIGFTWGASDTVTVRGGIGLYSGGNPNVWISNAYSNDGLTNVQLNPRYFDCCTVFGDPMAADFIPLTGSRPGYDVPQSAFDFVADALTPRCADGSTPVGGICADGRSEIFGNDSSIVLIDPNYKQPGLWKYAIGATWDMPWGGITADFDYIHSEQQDPAKYVDLSQTIVGTTIIGQPIYDFTNGSDNFMLTNGSREGSADLFSIMLSKDFGNGLDISFGYAYTEAEDVMPMTSSVARSNFENLATNDINDPIAGPSNYVVPHRITFRVSYATEFFGDLTTRFGVFGYFAEGQPQGYSMGNSGALEGDGFFARHNLYVPTGLSDSNVCFQPAVAVGAVNPCTGQVATSSVGAFDSAAFFAWVAAEGLPSGLQTRNRQHAPWTNRIDLRIDQDIPTFMEGTRGRIFFKLYNVANFLSSDWGAVKDAEFFTQQAVIAQVDGTTGQYIFEEFNNDDGNEIPSIVDLREQRSLWEARLGLDIFFGD